MTSVSAAGPGGCEAVMFSPRLSEGWEAGSEIWLSSAAVRLSVVRVGSSRAVHVSGRATSGACGSTRPPDAVPVKGPSKPAWVRHQLVHQSKSRDSPIAVPVEEKGASSFWRKAESMGREADWGVIMWERGTSGSRGEDGGVVKSGSLVKGGGVGSEPKCWLGRGMGLVELGS